MIMKSKFRNLMCCICLPEGVGEKNCKISTNELRKWLFFAIERENRWQEDQSDLHKRVICFFLQKDKASDLFTSATK